MAPDDDSEEFFEALAGRRDRGSGPAALRDALAAQARTLREAEGASADALSDAERAQMASLKERLEAAGAFQPPAAPAPPASVIDRLRGWLFGASSMRLVGVAAAIAVASVLVLRLQPFGDDESRVMRGGATPAIVVPDPAARAQELESALRAAGAGVVVAQIGAREWSLAVEVPDASKVAAVQKLLRDAGFALRGPPPYEVAVRASK
jgi:hypothetical protein